MADAIILHLEVHVSLRQGVESKLLRDGAAFDVLGLGHRSITREAKHALKEALETLDASIDDASSLDAAHIELDRLASALSRFLGLPEPNRSADAIFKALEKHGLSAEATEAAKKLAELASLEVYFEDPDNDEVEDILAEADSYRGALVQGIEAFLKAKKAGWKR